MKKLLVIFLALLAAPAFATVGIWEDQTPQGAVADIQFTGDVGNVSNGRYQLPLVIAGTSNGGATTMTTTDTAVSTSATLVRKSVDTVGQAGTLADGDNGQIISILITELTGSGTFILTPTTVSGFTSITFDAVNEMATLLYLDDTSGWIVISSTATVNQ